MTDTAPPRTDGMKRRRRFDAWPAGNSPGELEEKAMATARECFGKHAQLEMDDSYVITQRLVPVHHSISDAPQPLYGARIKVYELVPDHDRDSWRHQA
jgi:hypothetical protein